jgi:hypothetical protein
MGTPIFGHSDEAYHIIKKILGYTVSYVQVMGFINPC